jgi:virginiamycin A acetyltransferase
VSAVGLVGDEQRRSLVPLLKARRTGAAVSFNQTILTADSRLMTGAEVRSHASIRSSTIGRYSSVGRFSKVAWADVGSFSMISWDVTVGAMPHATDRATTHFFPVEPEYGIHRGPLLVEDYPRVLVGSDVWIGCHAVLLSGVRVGNGAIIAAGAVVTRDVGSFEIAAGVPARPVRHRLPRDLAGRLDRIGWWDWPDEVLREHLALFRQPVDEDVLTRLETIAHGLVPRGSAPCGSAPTPDQSHRPVALGRPGSSTD